MKTKFVSESIEEAWVSTNTGKELYTNSINNVSKPEENFMESPDISSMIPPPDIKLNPTDFDRFVNQLIKVIPENPTIAEEIFKRTILQHPYLMKKRIGFVGENPYENTIDKFIDIINHQK